MTQNPSSGSAASVADATSRTDGAVGNPGQVGAGKALVRRQQAALGIGARDPAQVVQILQYVIAQS